jgi:protease-4
MTLLLGTALVLIVVFFAIVLLFFAFSSLVPSVTGKCVAVVDIDQELSVDGVQPSLFTAGVPGSEDIANAVRDLNKRDDVGAVLFVVNSPGGSVVATREIYDAIKTLDKPKVSYLREVAASGGYYVASGADYIISDPDALTGSIGVITTVTDMSGLLDKIGVNVTAITSGPHKDIGSEFRNMTPEEQVILQTLINETYDEFRSIVLENRKGKLDMAKFDEITDGRVLSGRQAAKVGLVDQVGSKRDAILKAAQLANITAETADDVRLCPVTTLPSGSGGLFSADSIIRQLQAKAGLAIGYR